MNLDMNMDIDMDMPRILNPAINPRGSYGSLFGGLLRGWVYRLARRISLGARFSFQAPAICGQGAGPSNR